LPAQIRLGLLVEQEHPPPGPGQLCGGGQPRQPRAYHDCVRVHLVIKPHSSSGRDTRYDRLVADRENPDRDDPQGVVLS
jgi:hypothetical protein